MFMIHSHVKALLETLEGLLGLIFLLWAIARVYFSLYYFKDFTFRVDYTGFQSASIVYISNISSQKYYVKQWAICSLLKLLYFAFFSMCVVRPMHQCYMFIEKNVLPDRRSFI